TTYACPAGYTKIGWDTTGSGWRYSRTPGIVVGQNDYATVFCCKF
ncbi:shufflon system plasmid conjugative transfer pilus tip adhesin PilV, partial [Pseudomonas aeruginosa]